MSDQNALVTVFRSADSSAEADAREIQERLVSVGIRAIVLGDDAPGVVEGSWEVRAPAQDQDRAAAIVDAPPPEPEDEEEVPDEALSHDLDFVPVFRDQGAEAEMEAISIRSLLEANGIPSVMIGSSQIPSFPFEVRVPKSRLEEAKGLLESARQSEPSEDES
jgi:hypothetical protein